MLTFQNSINFDLILKNVDFDNVLFLLLSDFE